jgi:hypothetical protein
MKLLLLILTVSLVGCSVARQAPTPIVKKAQSCGAGELEATSTMAVQDWFGKHRECAVVIDAMCKPVRGSAPTSWADSTEGRVCTAARNVAQWVRLPNQDHETFESGWK